MSKMKTWADLKESYAAGALDHWEALKKPKSAGRKKNISTPKAMWELFCDYGAHVDANPIIRFEVIRGGERSGDIIEVPAQRPYTWSGFAAWLYRKGVVDSLDFYRQNWKGNYAEFQGVLRVIGDFMWSQKFEGAAAGIFKENIISRELNLKEQATNEIIGEQQVQPIINVYQTGPTLSSSEDEVDQLKPQ
jgi:hypothetical protein